MRRRPGPKTRIDAATLVRFLDGHSTYVVGGHPVRQRRCINGQHVTESDARMIRRWRAGNIQGVTESTARLLLRRYQLPEEVLNGEVR